jgi:hypothetical protein
MGENAGIFKLFDGFSKGKRGAEIRLRFSNLLSGPAQREAGSRLWHFHEASQEVRHRCNERR